MRTTSSDRLRASGELIALSGGEAGAVNACFTCHGLDGRGNGAGAPRLAGLDVGYLFRQLQGYDDGLRRHPQMRWISRRLSDEDRWAVAAWYAAMPWQAASGAPDSAVPAPRLWAVGDAARDLPSCASCHGLEGGGMGAANPALAGQPAAYQIHQLESWQRAERRTDPGGVMLSISRRLTAAEVAVLAAHASGLGGTPSPEAAPR